MFEIVIYYKITVIINQSDRSLSSNCNQYNFITEVYCLDVNQVLTILRWLCVIRRKCQKIKFENNSFYMYDMEG